MREIPEGRSVRFRAAYDKRHHDPRKNYGIHGVEAIFVLRRGQYAVDWTVHTNWQLPHVVDETLSRYADDERRLRLFMCPDGAAVTFHGPARRYESQEGRDGCTITGGTCYGDVGFTLGGSIMPMLIEGGDDAVWAKMESLLDEWVAACPSRQSESNYNITDSAVSTDTAGQ